ncbi:MAG: DUF2868 domain-containing protein [Gammaproteobacteria bacterium]|nr:DUF2868 domain-containing protein [Gammaproteobacteria bacterium]
MAISNFDKRVLIEQIRYLEAEDSLACETEAVTPDFSASSDFEGRLWQRAQSLANQYSLFPVLGRAARLSRYANNAAVMVAVLLGVLGIQYAFTDSHTVNIYWLLLVLLGFNFISMLLWLIGISLNMQGLLVGVLTRMARWLPDHLIHRSRSGTQADRAWLACHYGGSIGKWQFSKITHQLWLAYLLAGLVFLVLLLMVRQYDFVWGTTLLSDTAFVKLTDILSAPLQALGLTMPSADQVQDTRMGVLQILTAEHRSRWAQFLLAALLCFGVVPRMLLWCWSAIMVGDARRHFKLDHYLPYYIHLRQQLMPLTSYSQIIDADISAPVVSEIPVTAPLSQVLPAKAKWVAVELGDSINWPLLSIDPDDDLGQVIDRRSLMNVLQRIQSLHNPVIAVAVLSARSPDRGVQRVIADLMSSSEQRWLVLLQSHEYETPSGTRLAAWYRLAEACKVPADHVIGMSIE